MKRIPVLLLLLIVLTLGGCKSEERKQAVVNLAASIYETGEAQKRGVDVGITSSSIQIQASAICAAFGVTYPPKKPETAP